RGRKVELRIDRGSRILASQWSIDVGEVCILNCVGPNVVILRFKTLDQGWIVREVDGFVEIVGVWRVGNEKVSGVIGAAKLQLTLSGKQHHLPVQYSIGRFVAHWYTGRFQLLEHLGITGVSWISARVYEYAHGNTGFEAVNDLRRIG